MAKYLSLFAMLVCLLYLCSCQQKTTKQSVETTEQEQKAVEQEYSQKSQETLLEEASKDDVNAIFELARRADYQSNATEAFRLFLQAAEKGHISAQNIVAGKYVRGRGVEQNIPEGLKWLNKAADAGDPSALSQLALLYALGNIVKQDGERAVELAKKAIEAGDYNGYFTIGYIHEKGIGGVKADYGDAFSYYIKGAEHHDASCEKMVGLSYYYGDGVEKDQNKGITWLQLAAKHGDGEAESILMKLGVNQ